MTMGEYPSSTQSLSMRRKDWEQVSSTRLSENSHHMVKEMSPPGDNKSHHLALIVSSPGARNVITRLVRVIQILLPLEN
jgi:hypothetical protein